MTLQSKGGVNNYVHGMKQRTLGKEASVKGKALHTGQEVTLTLKPGAPNTGLVFRRIDLFGKPEVRPVSEMVTDLERKTTVSSDAVKLHTIEHVLSALSGMGVDRDGAELRRAQCLWIHGSDGRQLQPGVYVVQNISCKTVLGGAGCGAESDYECAANLPGPATEWYAGFRFCGPRSEAGGLPR